MAITIANSHPAALSTGGIVQARRGGSKQARYSTPFVQRASASPSSRYYPSRVAEVAVAATATEEQDEHIRALYEQFEALLDDYTFSYSNGDKVIGTVVEADNKGAYVDIGSKTSAYIAADEFAISKPENPANFFAPGEQREFLVIKADRPDEAIRLSLRRIEFQEAWEELRKLKESDGTVEGSVIQVNRGGALVSLEKLRGFVPSSHLGSYTLGEELVGQAMKLKFLEVDEARTRLVLSARLAQAEQVQEVCSSLIIGEVKEGTVQAVKPYGVFVDLGMGFSGLLHVSQISADHVASVESVFSPGDKLKVLILTNDLEKKRVTLSTRKLEPSPGDMLKNPEKVFEKAEEMAATFRERIAMAEAAAELEDQRLRGGEEQGDETKSQ